MVNMQSKQKVLITGGAGFIGSSLSNLLCDEFDVILVDNLSTGDWTRINGTATKVDMDIAKAPLREICKLLLGVKYVFHLAAVKLHNESNSNISVIENNIIATNNLLEACISEGVKKVLFTSSLYAYGHMHLPKMTEETTLEPKTVYGLSKVTGEGLLKIASENRGIDYAIARLFFVYGPKQFASGGYKSVIIKNFELILNGDKPIINGTGDQVLDYVYIDDCVYYLKEMMFSNFTGTANISSGNGVSVASLVEEMNMVAGASGFVFGEKDWTAGSTRIGDNELLSHLFPNYTQTPRIVGLEKTLNHLRMTAGFR
jgi:UDP-glucose 4-epimerase